MATNSVINTSNPIAVASGGTGDASFTAYTVICAGTTTTGALQNVSGVGSSGQVLTSNGASMLPTWQAGGGGGGITWNNTTGSSATLAINNGYIANNAGLVTYTLPSTAAVGSVIYIVGSGAGGWTIVENSGQTIHFGTKNTTTTSGSLSSSNQYDQVGLICNIADTDFVILYSQGNITVV